MPEDPETTKATDVGYLRNNGISSWLSVTFYWNNSPNKILLALKSVKNASEMHIMTDNNYNSSNSVHRYFCDKIDCERYEKRRMLQFAVKFMD